MRYSSLVAGLASACAALTAQAPDRPHPPAARALDRAVQRMHRSLAPQLDIWTDHSKFENAWVASSEHFTVRTTLSHGLAADVARGLETMLGHIHRTLGIDTAPPRRLPVYVFATRAEYNAFGATNGDQHSSFYGSFYAANHADRPVAAEWSDNPILAQMQITHSVVHQYLREAFPGVALPLWLDEGLAAYFASFWDYGWTRAEYKKDREQGRIVPLARVLRAQLQDFALDTTPRMLELAMFCDWLLRYCPETKSTPGADGAPHGAFVDYVRALLRGDDVARAPFRASIADPQALVDAFDAFTFPH